MRIAIMGATSQIAKDLIQSFAHNREHNLVLYARRPQAVMQWLTQADSGDRYAVLDFSDFSIHEYFDAILNFVGVGNPAKAAAMGASVFEVTLAYDELALTYLKRHPTCRYIFLSSGAVYGSNFQRPADACTKTTIDINHLQPQDWYGISKLYAECRHRAMEHLSIVDIRIFNYFSHTQDLRARFLITDILRSIRDGAVLKISPAHIIRDYLHPSDFYQLVNLMLSAPLSTNTAVDCYTLEPIDKHSLLELMSKKFCLKFEFDEVAGINSTGIKPNYYSLNYKASEFGYQPKLTSVAGILQETSVLYDQSGAIPSNTF
jgi:nucleoside-diphosphate-sugar epimerase